MVRAPVGWLLAAFAVLILAFAWGQVYSPLVHTTFGITIEPSGRNAAVTDVVPGSAVAETGVRRGDTVLLGALTLSERYRLFADASPLGTPLTLRIERAGLQHIVTARAQYSRVGRRLQGAFVVFAALLNCTLTLLVVALIALRRPSIASAALVWFGCGTVSTLPMTAELTWIPDPWFGAVAAVVFTAFSTLPILALVPFITRFLPIGPDRNSRANVYAGDAIFLAGAVVFALQSIYEPLLFSSWTRFDVWSQVATVLIVLIFVASVYHDASGEARRRIGWVFAGLVVSAVGYMAFDIVDICFNLRRETRGRFHRLPRSRTCCNARYPLRSRTLSCATASSTLDLRSIARWCMPR